jgi:hypothetical protein
VQLSSAQHNEINLTSVLRSYRPIIQQPLGIKTYFILCKQNYPGVVIVLEVFLSFLFDVVVVSADNSDLLAVASSCILPVFPYPASKKGFLFFLNFNGGH